MRNLFKKKKDMMFEEINQQPQIIKSMLDLYLNNIDSLVQKPIDLDNIKLIQIIASGSSKNSGDCVKYFIEKVTKIPVRVDFASEFAHSYKAVDQKTIVIAISQSGETADTYEALKVAKSRKSQVIAITNNLDSKIHNAADVGININTGKEYSVAATKSFTAQLLALYLLGIYISEKTKSQEGLDLIKKSISKIPEILTMCINEKKTLLKASSIIKKSKSTVFLGRSSTYAIAKEGALKLKETSYIDANGYPSGEFMHGHFAFVDKKVPVISIIPSEQSENYTLCINNTKEVKTKRKSPLIILKNQSDKNVLKEPSLSKSMFINLPDCDEYTLSFASVVIFQLLAYYTAKLLNHNVDKPRSLSKAVLTE